MRWPDSSYSFSILNRFFELWKLSAVFCGSDAKRIKKADFFRIFGLDVSPGSNIFSEIAVALKPLAISQMAISFRRFYLSGELSNGIHDFLQR
jgi:hypothetical protein